MGVLQDDAQRLPQRVLADLPDVDAVVGDGSLLDVVEAVDEVGDGGLSGAGGTHEGDFLAGLGKEGDIVEHHLIRIVAEGDVVEAHVAPQLCQGAVGLLPCPVAGALGYLGEGIAVLLHPDDGGLALVLLRLGLHDGEDALGAGYGGQNGVHLLADLAHRLGHLLDVQQIGPQRADVEHAAHGKQSAYAAGDGVVDAGEVGGGGHHGPGVGLGRGGRRLIGIVAGRELVDGLLLVVEHLDDLLTLDHLLNVAVEVAQSGLLPLEADPAASTDDLHHQKHQTKEGEGDQSQRPVQIQQHPDGAQERQGVGQHIGEAVVDHFGHRVDVVGEAAHEVAGLVGVEVAQGEPLQLIEQILTQGGHRALGHPHHDAGVHIGAQSRQHEHQPHQHQQLQQTGEVAGEDVVVDGGLEEVAAGHGTHGAEQQADGHQHQQALIAAHIVQQLLHRTSQVLGPLIAVAAGAVAGSAGTAGRHGIFLFSHRCSPLPAETDRLPDRSDWTPSAVHGSPYRRSCRRPALRSRRRP